MTGHMKMALVIFVVVMFTLFALAWQHGKRFIAGAILLAAAALVVFFVTRAEAFSFV